MGSPADQPTISRHSGQTPKGGGSAAVARPPWLEQLHADLERRWQSGERVLVESYLDRWPQLLSHPETLLDLLAAEIVLRERHGETPQVEEYLRRFPDLAESLRQQFTLIEVHGS